MAAIRAHYRAPDDARMRSSKHPVSDTFRSFDASKDTVPPTGAWAKPLDAASADYVVMVCQLLTSNVFGCWARGLRRTGPSRYPDGWESGPHRTLISTFERLFLRLGIEHVALGESAETQVDWWYDDASNVQKITQVPFAYPRAGHPWLQFRFKVSRGTYDLSFLADLAVKYPVLVAAIDKVVSQRTGAGFSLEEQLAGLTSNVAGTFTVPNPPSEFAFPLDWRLALTLGLLSASEAAFFGGNVPDLGITTNAAVLPRPNLDDDEDPDGLLDELLGKIPPVLSNPGIVWIGEHGEALAVGVAAILVSQKQLVLAAKAYQLVDGLLDVLDAATSAVGHINAANAEGLTINRALEQVLHAAISFSMATDTLDDNLEGLLGVDYDGALGLARALSDEDPWFNRYGWKGYGLDGWNDPDLILPLPTPVVYLGDCFKGYAAFYNGFEQVEVTVNQEVMPSELGLKEEWEAWVKAISPTLQVAQAFDAAGRIVRAFVGMDDALGSAFSALARAGGTLSADMQGVLSPFLTLDMGRMLGFLARQALTDLYIEYMVREKRCSRECLYGLFCWMDSAGKRQRIRTALGQLVKLPVPDALASTMERHLGAAPNSIWVRACITEFVDGSGPPTGALGDLFSRILSVPGQECLSAILSVGLLDPEGAAKIRSWYADCEQSCCRFLNTWEPDWEQPVPTVPDDFDPDPESPILEPLDRLDP